MVYNWHDITHFASTSQSRGIAFALKIPHARRFKPRYMHVAMGCIAHTPLPPHPRVLPTLDPSLGGSRTGWANMEVRTEHLYVS